MLSRAPVLLVVSVLLGCGPTHKFAGDADEDGPADGGETDMHADAVEDPAGDPPADTPVDGEEDGAPDAPRDATEDGPPDTSPDVEPDPEPDPVPDPVVDPVVDTPPDSVVTPGTDCDHPVVLTSLTTWSGSLSSYTNSWSGGSGCRSASGREIWFTAVVAAGDLFKMDETSGTDVVMHRLASCSSSGCMWSSDSPESFSFINNGSSPVTLILVVESYYSGSTGPVTLSISNGAPPAGNLCSDAIDVTSVRSWSGSYDDYGDIRDAPTGCSGASGPEVWFTADVPDGQIFTFEETSSTDVVLERVASCSSTSCIDYHDTPESFSVYNDTGSTMTLTMAVERYFHGGGSVAVATEMQAPFAGSMCTQAIDVTSVSTWTGHYDSFVDLWEPGSSCGSAGGSEVWFTAVVQAGHTFRLEETTSTDVVIERVASCSSTSCIDYWDFTEIFTYPNTTGSPVTLYVIVEAYFSSGGPVSLTINNAP
jgi:hypothetical protein